MGTPSPSTTPSRAQNSMPRGGKKRRCTTPPKTAVPRAQSSMPRGGKKRKDMSPLERMAARERRFAAPVDDIPRPRVTRMAGGWHGGRIRTNFVPNLCQRVARERRQAERTRDPAVRAGRMRALLTLEAHLLSTIQRERGRAEDDPPRLAELAEIRRRVQAQFERTQSHIEELEAGRHSTWAGLEGKENRPAAIGAVGRRVVATAHAPTHGRAPPSHGQVLATSLGV